MCVFEKDFLFGKIKEWKKIELENNSVYFSIWSIIAISIWNKKYTVEISSWLRKRHSAVFYLRKKCKQTIECVVTAVKSIQLTES